DIEQADANGTTPLLNASINATVASEPNLRTEHMEVAWYLMDQGADIDVSDWYGQTPLYAAIDLRNVEVPGPVTDNGIDREAAMDLVRELLKRGANPNIQIQQVLPVRRWITRLGNLSWVNFTGQM